MARTRRVQAGAELEFRSVPAEEPRPVRVRDYVMVNESVWRLFHRRWNAIEREWRSGHTIEAARQPGFLETVQLCVDAARDALRAEVREHAKEYPGDYLIPV